MLVGDVGRTYALKRATTWVRVRGVTHALRRIQGMREALVGRSIHKQIHRHTYRNTHRHIYRHTQTHTQFLSSFGAYTYIFGLSGQVGNWFSGKVNEIKLKSAPDGKLLIHVSPCIHTHASIYIHIRLLM